MSTRPTPYGLNAAVSLARWGEQTDLELADGEVVRARLDMSVLDATVAALEGRLEVVRALRVTTHPAVSVRAGRAFLPERFPGGGGAVEVSVRATRPVVRTLELARCVPTPFSEVTPGPRGGVPRRLGGRIDGLVRADPRAPAPDRAAAPAHGRRPRPPRPVRPESPGGRPRRARPSRHGPHRRRGLARPGR